MAQIQEEEVKNALLFAEHQNILTQSKQWEDIVNETVFAMNGILNLSSSYNYQCNVEPSDHLHFLSEYNGECKKYVAEQKQFNYDNTLYPKFIESIEEYLNIMASELFQNDEENGNTYFNIMIYKILSCLLALHRDSNKAPFFVSNVESKLQIILKNYGSPQSFNSAINYFDEISNKYLHSFQRHNNPLHAPHDVDSEIFDAMQNHNQPFCGQEEMKNTDAEYWKKQYFDLKSQSNEEQKSGDKMEMSQLLKMLQTAHEKIGELTLINEVLRSQMLSLPSHTLLQIGIKTQCQSQSTVQAMADNDQLTTQQTNIADLYFNAPSNTNYVG